MAGVADLSEQDGRVAGTLAHDAVRSTAHGARLRRMRGEAEQERALLLRWRLPHPCPADDVENPLVWCLHSASSLLVDYAP